MTASGAPPSAPDGADAAAVLLRDAASGEVARIERNDAGTFYRVYQPNKWAAKRAEAQARAAAGQAVAVA